MDTTHIKKVDPLIPITYHSYMMTDLKLIFIQNEEVWKF